MFDFNNIELPENNNQDTPRQRYYVNTGLQPLTINTVELIYSSQKQTPGAEVTFADAEGIVMKETFWLSEKALPRVQYLVKGITGEPMTGQFATNEEVVAVLAAKLVGKTANIVVDGENRTKEKDGKTYTNTYPVLRYRDFINPEGKSAEPIITDKVAATPVTATEGFNLAPATTESDLPW